MIEGKTKIQRVGKSRYFLIPYGIHTDSAFPFKESHELKISINGKKIEIKPA